MEGMIGEVFIFNTDGGTAVTRHSKTCTFAHDNTESRLTDTDQIDWIPLQNLTETTAEGVYTDDLIIG